MGDLDCGDCNCCGDTDCCCGDCDGCCGDCDCCCCCCGDCSCLDNCCTGETNLILCCFYTPPFGNTARANHRNTSTDCSICCCFGSNERTTTSRTPSQSSKNKKRKGFCWRLKSCFGRKPSLPARDQPKMENVPPMRYNQDGRYPMNDGQPPRGSVIDGKDPFAPWSLTRDQPKIGNMPPMGYKQDGRYPMNNSRPELSSFDYEEQHRRRVQLEELGMPQQGYIMDGRWSKPVKNGAH